MTQLLKADQSSILAAAELLKQGQLVAFPTETVYGLGANALDAEAVLTCGFMPVPPENVPAEWGAGSTLLFAAADTAAAVRGLLETA